MFNGNSNFTLGITATMLCTKLDSLNVELSLPNSRYLKNEKKIEISVDDKVKWSYGWTNTFTPPLGQELLIPLSSTVQFSLVGTHHILHHLLGSCSGRIIDFLDKETPLRLEDDRHVAGATITIRLSPVVDYQQALSDWVDTSLARVSTNPRLVEGLDDVDQVVSTMQTMDYAVETSGQYIVPLGQALRLMIKLIDNVAEAHPFLTVGWSLLSSVYTAVQQQRLDDHDVWGLAESLRELVGVAGDCLVAEIKGTPDYRPILPGPFNHFRNRSSLANHAPVPLTQTSLADLWLMEESWGFNHFCIWSPDGYLRKLTWSRAALVHTELLNVPSLGIFLHLLDMFLYFLDTFGRMRHHPRPELLILILEADLALFDALPDIAHLRLAEKH
ncbi:hypothetical protein PAXINDRAFT_13906 [Paxillus involutus ATCC 200175]|uniref:Uncharacterized protein n=1 Tax=Paxillus involutus ATCC 200175 TaxID=664439 RepID=A0A0C9TSP8_PAXIN|nr:hypothetical protein PAXINDRAFT_13906 [Paxillus involutus ATCC 200175]